MKKLLITVLPILVILFCYVWIVFGLKFAISYFTMMLFATMLVLGTYKWVEFINKHIKD